MRLLYRADGGRRVGTGHLFRAVRILRELSSRGPLDATLVYSDEPGADAIVAGAPAQRHLLPPLRDPQAVKPLLEAAPVLDLSCGQYDLLCVDMLDTPDEEMAALSATGVPIVTFDDRGPGRRYAHTVIDVLITEPEPATLPGRLLEGGPYVVIDPLYAAARGSYPRPIEAMRDVFVSLGGADAAGLSVKVARELKGVEGLRSVVFGVGPAFPHEPELCQALAGAPWEFEIRRGMPNLLPAYLECDLAIVAGGLTMYEVCCVGVPALAVCQPIDHQPELAARLAAAGAMATVGYGHLASEARIAEEVSALADDPARRRAMHQAGPAIVDGRGVERVADALIQAAVGP